MSNQFLQQGLLHKSLAAGRFAIALVLFLPTVLAAQIDVSNPANPFDDIGKWHNQALDDAIEAADGLGSQHPTLMTLVSIERASEFSRQIFGADGWTQPANTTELALYFQDAEAFASLQRQRMEPEQSAFYDQLMAVAAGFEPGMSDDEASQVIDQLRHLEADMQSSLGEEQAQPLLAAASVGRYSYAYWSQQQRLGPASAWPGFGDGDTESLIPPAIQADIAGAISGGINGAGGGVAGVLGGALQGAAISSAVSWIFRWF